MCVPHVHYFKAATMVSCYQNGAKDSIISQGCSEHSIVSKNVINQQVFSHETLAIPIL